MSVTSPLLQICIGSQPAALGRAVDRWHPRKRSHAPAAGSRSWLRPLERPLDHKEIREKCQGSSASSAQFSNQLFFFPHDGLKREIGKKDQASLAENAQPKML
jgi:hypothetical protein